MIFRIVLPISTHATAATAAAAIARLVVRYRINSQSDNRRKVGIPRKASVKASAERNLTADGGLPVEKAQKDKRPQMDEIQLPTSRRKSLLGIGTRADFVAALSESQAIPATVKTSVFCSRP